MPVYPQGIFSNGWTGEHVSKALCTPLRSPHDDLTIHTIENVDHEAVSRLCPLDGHRPGEVVDLREIDVHDIVAEVVVADLGTGPVYPRRRHFVSLSSICYCSTRTYRRIEL